MTDFLTLGGTGEAETRVQASRFLAFAFPVGDESEARAILEQRERTRFDASHHCAAWRLRGGTWRALDAGEPSGSAGPPILAAIDALDLVDAGVIVTRYFGGTKLGVGGLIRAYGGAAAAALAAAPRRMGAVAARVRVDYPYDLTAPVMRAIERFGAADVDHAFAGADDHPRVRFTIPVEDLAAVRDFVRDQSGGVLEPEVEEETVLYRPTSG